MLDMERKQLMQSNTQFRHELRKLRKELELMKLELQQARSDAINSSAAVRLILAVNELERVK